MDLEEELAAFEAQRRAVRSFMTEEKLAARDRANADDPKMAACDNLLRKARLTFVLKPDKCRDYIDRAVALGFDEREECYPAAASAHMILFNLITDEIEQSAQDDSEWVDVAIELLETVDDYAQSEIRSVLAAIADLPGEYQLTSPERGQINRALARVPEAPDLWAFAGAPEELGERILAVLEASRHFEDMLDERFDPDLN